MNNKRNRTAVCLGVCAGFMAVKVSGMQMGGFDLQVNEGEYYEWQWEEEQWSWGEQETPDEKADESDGYQKDQHPETQEQGFLLMDEWQRNESQQNESQQNGTDQKEWQENMIYGEEHGQWEQEQIAERPDPDQASILIPTSTPTPISTATLVPALTPTKKPELVQSPTPVSTPTAGASEQVKKKKKNDASQIRKKSQWSQDERIEFKTQIKKYPEIHIISQGSVQVLSLRLNKMECPWHWEGDRICLERGGEKDENTVELLVISQGGKLVKMSPWIFCS